MMLLHKNAAPYLSRVLYGLRLCVIDGARTARVTANGELQWSRTFIQDVLRPLTRNPKELDELVCKVLAHEVVHVLLGHTSSAMMQVTANWVAAHRGMYWEDNTEPSLPRSLSADELVAVAMELQVNYTVDLLPRLSTYSWCRSTQYLWPAYKHLFNAPPTSLVGWMETLAARLPTANAPTTTSPLPTLDDRTVWIDLESGGDGAGSGTTRADDAERQAIVSNLVQQCLTDLPDTAPATLRALAPATPQSQVPWNERLFSSVAARAGGAASPGSYSYRVPHRRQAVMGWVGAPRLPSVQRVLPHIVFVIDTSGSMSDRDVQVAIGEIESVLDTSGGEITVVGADSDVRSSGRVSSAADARALAVGGGGTDFNPAYEFAVDEGATQLIYFTDGFGRFPKEERIPTLWISTTPPGQVLYPFGEVVYVNTAECK